MQWLKQRAILIGWAMRVPDLHRLTASTEHAAATRIHSALTANNRMCAQASIRSRRPLLGVARSWAASKAGSQGDCRLELRNRGLFAGASTAFISPSAIGWGLVRPEI